MKAFIFGLIIFFTLISTASPVLAQATDYPTTNSTTKTFTAPKATITPTPQATTSGRIRVIPNADGSYKVIPLDPQSAAQIKEAGFCDVPVLGTGCDIVGDVWDNLTDCLTAPIRLDVGDLIYDCSGASTVVDLGKKPAEWALGEIMTAGATLIKLGVGIVGNAVTQMLVGCEFKPGDTECWEEQTASILNPNAPVKNAGAVMMLAQITGDVASLQIPLSTELYLANINPFKDASADGLGDLTQPNKNRIFEIWKNARDAAYVLSIVILVIVGFLIMLRAKLDPKTAVNLTNSLPKIIAMLLLITFSLAISGLIIDLGRIILQLALSILPNVGLNDIGRMFLNTIWAVMLPIIVLVVIVGVATGGTGIAVVLAGGLIILLLLAIIMFVVCAIILFKLVIRYAKFLLSVMFAPLVFLALPLPGGGKIVSDYIKRQVAYMLTIPITVVLIELSWLIAGSCIPSPFSGGIAGAPNQGLSAVQNHCGGVKPTQGQDNGYNPFLSQVEAQSVPVTSAPSFNPFGLFSMIAPFIGLGILTMATKADSIADDIMSIKPLGGHGGGKGGHGGLMALMGLQAVGHGMESVSDFSKGYTALKTPITNLMKRSAVRGGRLGNITPANGLTGNGANLMRGFPGSNGDGSEAVRVPTAATFAGGNTFRLQGNDLTKDQFDQKFKDAAPDFEKAGVSYPELETKLRGGNYLELLNKLGGHASLPALNQEGEIMGPRGSVVKRMPGRVFPMNDQQRKDVRRANARERLDLIDRAAAKGAGLPDGGRETPIFEERGDSGDRSPDTRDTE